MPRARVIVLGPRRRRWSDVFAGSTADRVIRATQVPVLIAHRMPAAAYARPLLAMDFGAASTAAAIAAAALRVAPSDSTSAVHVIDADMRDAAHPPLARQAALDAAMRRDWRAARLRLHALVETLPMTLRRARLVAPAGSVAQTLLTCADQEVADLIVTGTRQRARMSFENVLEGSVAQQLARAGACDVLVVPEAK